MKITDYEKVQALAASNIFLLDGPNGTKTITADALAKALIGLFKFQRFYRRSKSFRAYTGECISIRQQTSCWDYGRKQGYRC